MVTTRPPYRVPPLAEFNAAAGTNGYVAASTFSGCGGSCLGLKLAGFDVRFASEFVAEARRTYEANHPGVHVDSRDIRELSAADLLDVVGVGVGELDLLEGSPPCASFSIAGKRQRGWGQDSSYSDTHQRTDDLFWEFARLVEQTQPRVFIAENVPGLASGVARGYFKEIHARLSDCGYVVQARLLDASRLGVPQARRRLFFQGVRVDLAATPRWPTPSPDAYTLRDAIGLTRIIARRMRDSNGPVAHVSAVEYQSDDLPARTVMAYGVGAAASHQIAVYDRQPHDGLPTPRVDDDGFIYDPETDTRIDLYGVAIYRDWLALKNGRTTRYLSSVMAPGDRPSPVVTASAGGRGTAGVIFADEPRKFTLAELRRICSFPDDFVLTGTYQQRWERLGRAVPPLMMAAVGRALVDLLDDVKA